MNRNIAALAILTYASMVAAQGARAGYSTSNFSLELEGSMAGHLHSVDGGAISAPVIEEAAGQDLITFKHPGNPVYEDFNLHLGLDLPVPISSWIASSWGMTHQRKSGAVITSDFNYKEMRSVEFHDALLTATTFPACDATSKDPGYLSIQFSPEYTHIKKASGKMGVAPLNKKPSQFQSRNFRLKIDGLDCTQIVKIESLTVKRPWTTEKVAETRDNLKEPGKLEYPNLRITLSAASVESWKTWFEDFVVAGNNGQEQELTGTLEYLTPDLKSTLLTLKFEGLGIYRLGQQKNGDGSQEAILRYTAELYCEKITMTRGTVK